MPVETLLKFNTIKQHTTKPEVIVKAAQCLSSDLLTVSSDGKAIGRKHPFTSDHTKQNNPLTLVVTNLPIIEEEVDEDEVDKEEAKKVDDGGDDKAKKEEGDDGDNVDGDKKAKEEEVPEQPEPKQRPPKQRYGVTTQELRAMFERYGTITIVKLRFGRRDNSPEQEDDDIMIFDNTSPSPRKRKDYHHHKKHQHQQQQQQTAPNPRIPLGSALIEFSTAEERKKAADDVLTVKEETDAGVGTGSSNIKIEPKRPLTVGGKAIKVWTLQQYINYRKRFQTTTNAAAAEKGAAASPERDGSNKKRKRDDDDKDDTTESPPPPPPLFTVDWKPGCVIQLKGLSTTDCDREAILDAAMTGLGWNTDKDGDNNEEENEKRKLLYADYSRGQPDGAIRFPEPSEDIAKLQTKLSSGELLIAGSKVGSAVVLRDDDEKQYWDNFITWKNKKLQHRAEEERHHHGNSHRQRHRRGHHHHHYNKKRRRS